MCEKTSGSHFREGHLCLLPPELTPGPLTFHQLRDKASGGTRGKRFRPNSHSRKRDRAPLQGVFGRPLSRAMRDTRKNGAAVARGARRKRREGTESARHQRHHSEPLRLPPIAGASPLAGRHGEYQSSARHSKDARKKAGRKGRRQGQQLRQRFAEIRRTYKVAASPRPHSMGVEPAPVRLPRASPPSTRLRVGSLPAGVDSPAFIERRALLQRAKAFCRMLEERRALSLAHAGRADGARAAEAVKHSPDAESSRSRLLEKRSEEKHASDRLDEEARQRGLADGGLHRHEGAASNAGRTLPAKTAENAGSFPPADPSSKLRNAGEEKDSGADLRSEVGMEENAGTAAGTAEANSDGGKRRTRDKASANGADNDHSGASGGQSSSSSAPADAPGDGSVPEQSKALADPASPATPATAAVGTTGDGGSDHGTRGMDSSGPPHASDVTASGSQKGSQDLPSRPTNVSASSAEDQSGKGGAEAGK